MNLEVDKEDYYRKDDLPCYSEREIEMVLARRFYDEYKDDNFVEVGSVLENFDLLEHNVIDIQNSRSKCWIKKDALDWSYIGKSVLSISTLEHVGDFEFTGHFNKINDSVKLLEKIHNESKRYLVTYPVGYTSYQPIQRNPLDMFLSENYEKFNTLLYIRKAGKLCCNRNANMESKWEIIETNKKYFYRNYGCPFVAANVLVILYKNL